MKRLIVLLLVCAMCAPGVALAQGEAPLIIPAGQHEPGSVATVSQPIVVEGSVDGDVTSWSGAITISGSVGGDVVSYAGQVTIAPGGRVGGHVLASGGELRVGGGAAVAGQAIGASDSRGALASLLDLVMPLPSGGTGAAGRVLFGIVGLVLLVAFCVLYNALWPRRMQIASTTLQRFGPRAIGLGLITTVALGLALPALAAVLIASVVGLPVLVVVLVALLATYVYGLAVLARWIAGYAASVPKRGQGVGNAVLLIAGLLGLAVAGVAMLQPIGGAAVFGLLASPGVGAAILSRGGMALPLGAAQ